MFQLEGRLPPFARAVDIRRAAANALRAPAKVSVSQAAERHRYLLNRGGGYSGPWRNLEAPYLVEPMDRLVSRLVDLLAFIGPSQTGKTEILLNLICHAIKYRPADMLVLQPSRDLALDFAERRVENGLLAPARDLAGQVGPTVGDGKLLTKTFRNGMMLSTIWPVSGQVASRPVPTTAVDERDSIDDDINGEGDPVELLRRRSRTFGRNAICLVLSSPKRETYSGIVPLYDSGDQNLWCWPCQECGEYFTPGFDFARKPTLAHLSDDGKLICPHCGGLHEETAKPAMNARGLWLPKGMTVARDGSLSGTRSPSRVASYWLSGLVSPFIRWAEVAAELKAAQDYFSLSDDESKLRAFYNTTLGVPFRSVKLGELPLDAEALKRRAEDVPLGIAPAEAHAVMAAIDVQGDRFEILTAALGRGGETWPLDYRALFKTSDPTAPDGERLIDPAHRAEDWHLLLEAVLKKPIAVATSDGRRIEVLPAIVAIDTHGGAGVTGQAYEFFAWLRGQVIAEPDGTAISAHKRVMLLRGSPRRDGPIIAQTLIEESAGKRLKFGIKLHSINTEVLKDMVDGQLRRTVPGPGYVHLPRAWLEGSAARFFDEVTAEKKTAAGWEKVRPRNEAWDLLVYLRAAFVKKGGLRIDWDNPPEWWTQLGKRGAAIAPPPPVIAAPGAPGAPPAAPAPRAAAPAAAASPAAASGSWIGDRGKNWLS